MIGSTFRVHVTPGVACTTIARDDAGEDIATVVSVANGMAMASVVTPDGPIFCAVPVSDLAPETDD